MKPTEQDLKSLYTINKHAKKYSEQGKQNYRKGNGAAAKTNSVKKDALYTLKEKILFDLRRHATKINRHTIHGTDFYCLYFEAENKWSFHTPVEGFDIGTLEIDEEDTLDDFSKDTEKEHSDMSLKDTLLYIHDRFGYSANDYLTQERVFYGHSSYFTGWAYLEEDDEVGSERSEESLDSYA